MDDPLSDQSKKSVTYLLQHLYCFYLRTIVSSFDILGQISIAQFLDNIVIFGALHDIVEGDYVI